MSKPPGILHIDMDAFYAAVEQLDHPELRGKPVIVGGSAESRGVVATASYEARPFGVHSAMPTATAKKLCPQGIFVTGRMERYREVSRAIHHIFCHYTPLVEPVSLDEAFLDVRGSARLFGPAEEIGRTIKKRIGEEIHLTASVGVASNRFLAKLGSDFEKPDGFVVIPDEGKAEFLAPLPVAKLWGVGPATEKALHLLGVTTVAQLRGVPLEVLKDEFGSFAEDLRDLSMGVASDEVVPDREAKSISNETTFAADVKDPDELECVLLDLTEEVAFRVREAGFAAKTVTVKIRLHDFKTLSRSRTLPRPTNSTMEIFECARTLLRDNVNPRAQPVRLLGVGTFNFAGEEGVQRELFEPPGREKAAKVDRTVDEIRNKLGDDSIKRGRLL
jgi:DNA polymerase-4